MSILNEIQENKKLIHITTKEIADKISIEGFKPVKRLEFKYYSELGENGIYFYDNFRQAQQYAYWLSNKDKIDKVIEKDCRKIIKKVVYIKNYQKPDLSELSDFDIDEFLSNPKPKNLIEELN